MNRAERRARQHRKPQQRWNKDAAHLAINTMLVKCSTDEQNEHAHHKLIIPAYAALENLLAGRLDSDGYWRLQEAVTYAYLLATRLNQYAANDTTRAALLPCEAPLHSASELLAVLAERRRDEGRYRIGGGELDVLRQALDLVDQLTGVSTQGHTLSALIETVELLQGARPDGH